jgi:hypothetical protein
MWPTIHELNVLGTTTPNIRFRRLHWGEHMIEWLAFGVKMVIFVGLNVFRCMW